MLNKQAEDNKNSDVSELDKKIAKSSVYKQACMAGLAVIVTVVLIFSMTVAWYSNVIHTQNLVFETASWDFEFDGTVNLGTDARIISPGDSGIVSLELSNNSDDTIEVLVNVTKDYDGAVSEMKKRIYFYVDTAQLINGEYVEGIYINESDSFSYKVTASNSLVLSENYHSDAYLKWEWVYDVVGYYVTGTMNSDGTMTVDDYMKPVKYDLDTAVFDDDGKLLTVGGMSLDDYLATLYAADGYAGREVPEAQNGYYPVVTDSETGYGIWLYLCDEAEIMAATSWDTLIAEKTKAGETTTFTPKILLSGRQAEEAKVLVTTANDFNDALANDGVDRIVVNDDLVLDSTLTIPDEREVIIDLGENTLTLSNNVGFTAEEGSSLTILNGKLAGGDKTTVVKSVGAEITLSNTEISGYEAVRVSDNEGTGVDSFVKISECTINTSDVSVILYGNANASGSNVQLLIENSTITSDYIGVMGNGSRWGTDIEIVKSAITGKWGAVYQPQDNSTLTIKESTLEGYTGIAIKAGTVDIENSVILGTGAKGEPAFSNNGYTDTGDAVYIETNYEVDITLNISGENTLVKSTNSYAIQVYDPVAPQVNVNVTGGTYSSDITGFMPSGYSALHKADGTYVVSQDITVSE